MMLRRELVSAGYGIGSAVLIAYISPLYGGLIVILSFALVFRSAERVSLVRLFAAFTVAWCVVLAAGVGVIPTMTESGPGWAIAGFVPVALAGMTVLVARARSPSRQPAS